MFYVVSKQNPNNKEIYRCDALLHTKVKFEAARKKKEIAQCTRRQCYGHTKSHCHHSPRCVKCTGFHASTECSRKTKSGEVSSVMPSQTGPQTKPLCG